MTSSTSDSKLFSRDLSSTQSGYRSTSSKYDKVDDGKETTGDTDNITMEKGDLSKLKDLAPDETAQTSGLARTLTLTNAVSMIVGVVIGAGIFVSPTGVQKSAGSVGSSIIIWILCGIWCGLGAYIYAELGSLITKSGGDYVYMTEAFGPFIGFLRLWIESMVVRPVALTIKALTFALYVIRPFYPNCDPPTGAVELLAIAKIMFLCGVNCYSMKAVTRLQDWFTLAKVLALVMVIVTGGYLLLFGGPQYWDSFDNIFEGNFRSFRSAAVAFYSGLFAYQGWAYLNTVTEELINPKRNLPLAILISMIIITLVYVLYNVALYVVLSPDEMILHAAASVEFANKIYGRWAFIMPLFVAISTFGASNGSIMVGSRLYFCGAREGHFPLILAMTNKRLQTPIPSVVFMSIIAIGYMFLSSNVYVLINASQSTVWISYTLAAVALLVLRYSFPNARRPVKVNLCIPVVFMIGGSSLVVLSAIGAPYDTALGLIIVLTAVPIYVIFIAREQPRFIREFVENFTIAGQKLFMLLDENKKE
uniref:Amino acid permease domain containing protein n=1 Tax=Haemonchus contortus TaxID=6289 RepID=A0A7I4Y1Y1_HAECO